MRDRGVSHQAFDIGLPDCSDRPNKHRHNCQEGHDLLPIANSAAKGVMHHARKQRHGRHFRGCGEQGRHRCWRAFIDIGCPHMERRGRDLEGQTCKQEDKAEQHAKRQIALGGCGLNDACKLGCARKAVDQRGAIEQKARGQSAKHEIFQSSLGRAHAVTADRGDHIQRQRLKLEPHIKSDQIARGYHHHHADNSQCHQHRVFKAAHLVFRHEILAQD